MLKVRHISVVVVVAPMGAVTQSAGAISPERQAMDDFVQRIRQAKTQSGVGSFNLPGRDNDDAIDAFIDVIAHYEGRDRGTAAWYMAMGIGMKPTGPLSDPRRLDFMLPARVGPVLAAALREDSRAARSHLTQLLGSIDEPTEEVIATLRALLLSDDPAAQDDAAKGIGMLGRHAAGLAPDLERLLATLSADDAPGENGTLGRRVRIAGALAHVSDTVQPEALEVLIEGLDGAGGSAITQFQRLGERGESATGALLEHLPRAQNMTGDIVEAILFASPNALPEVLTTLVDMTVVTPKDIEDALNADMHDWFAGRQDLTEADRLRMEERRRLQDQQTGQTEQRLHRIAQRAEGMLSALPPALVWAHAPPASREPMPEWMYRIAGPLARVPDEAIAAASRTLVATALGGEPGAAARAVRCLAAMGPMASPALDALLAIHRKGDPTAPPVANAIVSIAPTMEVEILTTVFTRATSADPVVAAHAQGELPGLVANPILAWEDTPEMRAIMAAIIKTLAEGPASDGKALARALRRMGTPEARKAYNAHTFRGLREKSTSR